MSQFNVRFNVYDSVVENVLNTLKSCNKQAAFVRDAVKFYVDSKQGQKTFELMCGKKTRQLKQPKLTTCTPSTLNGELPQDQADGEKVSITEPLLDSQLKEETQNSILSKIFS